jgi:Ca-activated chloride channel family protein
MARFSFVVGIIIFGLVTAAYGQDSRTGKNVESDRDRATTPLEGTPERRLARPEAQPFDVPADGSEASEYVLSKQVHEVNLFVSVIDRKGRLVGELTAKDLKILDNHKTPERLSYFQARTDIPLRVILAIDVSSSIRDRLPFEQKAAISFLKHILRKEKDEAAIVAFGSNVQEKSNGMTSDIKALDSSIRSLEAYGETAMYDAIIRASQQLRENRKKGPVRPIIILITDGDDTASKQSLKAAEEAAIRSEASIFALDSNSIYEKDPKGRKVLDKLTSESGGFVLDARQDEDLATAFNKVEKILRFQYALGYPPPEMEADGSFRPIEIIPNRPDLHVYVRKGYYAPPRPMRAQ